MVNIKKLLLLVNPKFWVNFYGFARQLLLLLTLLLSTQQAMATVYNFSDSGVSPALSGCSRTGAGTYTCTSAVTLTGNDSITISGTTPATITFNSNLTLQFLNETTSAKINSGGSAANLNLIVNGTLAIGKKVIIMANIQGGSVSDTGGDVVFGGSINTTTGAVRLDYSSDVAGSITTTTGSITLNDQDTVGGSVTSTSGGIIFTNKSTISGNVSCTTCTFTLTGLSSTINGTTTVGTLNDSSSLSSPGTIYNNDITTLTGDAIVGYYATVNGNITAKSNIQIRNFADVAGDITSNNVSGSTLIDIWDDATVNGDISATASGIYSTVVYVRERITVTGSITTYTPNLSEVRIYTTSTVDGDITSFGGNSSTVFIWGTVVGKVQATATAINSGNVYLYASATVNGSVYVSSNIFNYGTVTGCAQTTNTAAGYNVYLYYGSSTYATCSGTTSCTSNTNYVYNGTLASMPPICQFTATNIAEYHFDENVFNGTSNETKDTAGYTGGPFDGQGIGSPVPTATTTSPAISGTIGTCGYATFSGSTTGGSAFTLDNLPVSTVNGAKTSVSFWMYWNGTNNVMPIGWNKYNLMFSGSNFGFNTDAGDLYGTTSTGLANGWHHVVAVFTNGSFSSNQIYIDGVNQTLRQTVRTRNRSSPFVQSTLQVSGYTTNTNYRFSGSLIDEVKVYNGGMTQAQVTADYNATHTCPSYNVVPSSFNCTIVGGAANTGHLYTQVAGSTFGIDVIALKASGAVETSYVTTGTKNVTLEFVDGSGSTACASRAALSPTISQTVTFAVSDAGRKTVSGVNIAKAYRDLRCRVTDANQTPNIIGCSSDDFAVRPASFTVTSSNANADSAGTSTTATPVIKTGANFNITAATGIVGYDGTPSVDVSKLAAHTGAIQAGTLSGSFSVANSSTGSASGVGFTYSEVGYFNLAANGVYDSTFTAVDSASGDCNSGFTASGSLNACSFGNTSATNYFGRFIPDHFAVSPSSVTPACSNSFTYFGQDGLTTSFTLTAQNSSNATTKNYTGSFAKLVLTNWANYNFSAATLPSGSALSASTTAPSGTWSSGSASITAKHQISRPSAATAPTSITISAAPTDSDGVTMTSSAVSTASSFKYGRLYMPNTYGSELLPLSVPIEAQYWNGSAYQRNQQDSCSVIPASSIAMSNYKSNLAACESVLTGAGTMSSGKVIATLSKPGSGNNGSVDLTVNAMTAGNMTCNSTTQSNATLAGASLTGLPWFGSNLSSRATFGLFKTPVIYMRENY